MIDDLASTSVAAVVTLGSGPPTREELLVHYPAKFTWNELKTFINSGDLGLLKRDRKLQQRYNIWVAGMKEKYGSIGTIIYFSKLPGEKPDTLSLLGSAVQDSGMSTPPVFEPISADNLSVLRGLPPLPADAPAYFSESTPPEYISIIQNDWPYSVPPEVEHTLVWTRVPIFHQALIPDSIRARVELDGLWGFTGNDSPPPSPSTLPACLPALAEWGVTLDQMIKSEKGTAEEDELVRLAGLPIHNFVKNRWVEEEWETAWFVNPPVSRPEYCNDLRALTGPKLSGYRAFLVWPTSTCLPDTSR
ncbi:Kinase-like protein [Mycena venus]|uniref:Kinase-like protein n=1 Tax=Mycena venus TaxID=2733690 RepID=A0A8H6YPI3_9AGAR|nr:Kinase-like protein [Mycena venus]